MRKELNLKSEISQEIIYSLALNKCVEYVGAKDSCGCEKKTREFSLAIIFWILGFENSRPKCLEPLKTPVFFVFRFFFYHSKGGAVQSVTPFKTIYGNAKCTHNNRTLTSASA